MLEITSGVSGADRRKRFSQLLHQSVLGTVTVANQDTVLEEATDNLKEAGQRIKATQNLMRSEDMTEGENHRDLLTRLSTALAMTEAAYLEARRRRRDL